MTLTWLIDSVRKILKDKTNWIWKSLLWGIRGWISPSKNPRKDYPRISRRPKRNSLGQKGFGGFKRNRGRKTTGIFLRKTFLALTEKFNRLKGNLTPETRPLEREFWQKHKTRSFFQLVFPRLLLDTKNTQCFHEGRPILDPLGIQGWVLRGFDVKMTQVGIRLLSKPWGI